MKKINYTDIKNKFADMFSTDSKLDVKLARSETEKKANIFCANFIFALIIIDIIYIVLTACRVVNFDIVISIVLFACLCLFHILTISLCYVRKGQDRWIKYFVLASLMATAFVFASICSYGFWILFALPIFVSCHYYNTKLTIGVSVVAEVCLALSILLGAYLGVRVGNIDINYAGIQNSILNVSTSISRDAIEGGNFSMAEYIQSMYIVYFIPHAVMLALFMITGIQGTNYGMNMLVEEAEVLAAKTKAEKEAADSKTQIMISQIQPHFIYNTLNSIYYLCDKEPETAKKAIADFSDYLRTNLNFMDKKAFVSFEQELEHIKKYLSLEKMRFEDELNVEYDIQCTTFKVPALSIQPLVENAVKHGICKRQGGGTIKIWSSDVLTYFEIGISDDGVGFDTSKPFDDNRRHIGLENTRERLTAMCGATVDITSEIGVGTTVLIHVPKENYYEDNSSR